MKAAPNHELSREAATALVRGADGGIQRWVSAQAIDGPAALGVYVRLACEALAAHGAWLGEAGELQLGGPGAIAPAASGARAEALAAAGGPKALRAFDDGLKDALAREDRAGLLVETLYARGRALTLGVAEVMPEEDASSGDDLAGAPPEIAEQMRQMMEQMRRGG